MKLTPRTRFQLGATAIAAALAAVVASCTGPPIGRTEYCYYYPTTSSVVTTMSTTTAVPTTPVPTAPPTTFCRSTPFDYSATTSTFVGYVAPVPAGTRVVK
jgi:hypothetical protein